MCLGTMAYPSCVTIFLLSVFLEVPNVLTLSEPSDLVCIIGAGYSGLAAARHMKDYKLNFTVFEASSAIGGTWRYDPRVGTDENGLPLFTSQYTNLRTNTPRETMEFVGYPFPEGTPSYPTGTCFYKYLHSFVKYFKLSPHIQLESLVTSVQYEQDKWRITYMKAKTKENQTQICTFVVVASGEYSSPYIPSIYGLENYKGKVLHSHDYKNADDYRDQRVLLVGAGASGLDLSIQLVNVTTKLVHSHHLDYNQPPFPNSYVKKPDIHKFTPTGAVFVDDTIEEFDVVIFCTGYNFVHPFLKQESSGIVATQKYVLPLYQHVVNIKYPKMTFVGVSKKVINKVMDSQAQYAAALAAGDFSLPPQGEMLRQWLDQVKRVAKITDVNVIVDMANYFELLHRESAIHFVPEVYTNIRDFNAKNRLEDILHYRDYDYKILNNTAYERIYVPRKQINCPIVD